MLKELVACTLILICTVSCSTLDQRDSRRSDSPSHASITLPQIPVPGLQLDHVLRQKEIADLSSHYFKSFVSGCGMSDKPVNEGNSWSVQLWGGIAGTDHGRLLISKDGRQVIYRPSKSELENSVRSRLARYPVPLE